MTRQPVSAEPASPSNERGILTRVRRSVGMLSAWVTTHHSLIETVVLIVGIVLTLRALNANTSANRTASRSQLYEAETVVNSREVELAGTRLSTIYVHPPASQTNIDEYIRVRLRALTSDSSVLAARNVEQLYDALETRPAFDRKITRDSILDARRAFIHVSAIVGMMHSAQDYTNEAVIDSEELDTWLGYARDIGPHPILLASIWNWEKAEYMSRQFAFAIRAKLLAADPRSEGVIRAFYPRMLSPEYGSNLKVY